MTARLTQKRRSGFTLVELLVVIAIIGILAAILVPTAGMVMTKAKEARINMEIKQLATAIEQYKTQFEAYPLDMSDPYFLQAHLNKISRRHKMGVVFNPADPTDDSTWYGADLPNPWQGTYGGPTIRRPIDMDQSEALVFFLSELCKNADYPLGYRREGSNWVYVAGDRYEFYEFKETNFRDYDEDGWREYIQPSGPKVPIVYFASQTYSVLDRSRTPVTAVGVSEIQAADPTLGWVDARGLAKPYLVDIVNRSPVYVEPEKFQLIAAGMDGDFGDNPPGSPQKRFDAVNKQYAVSTGDLDNFTNFADGRLDKDSEQ